MSVLHSHSHAGHSHSAPAGRALWWTIVFNVIITVAQFVVGILSGFLALIADAAHNLSDVAALVLAHVGEKAAQAPATKTSTYGKKRAEVLTALISAISLIVIAGFIFYEAFERFVAPHELKDFSLFFIVAIIGLLGNVASVWILRSDETKSINRRTALLHLTYDTFSSVAIILGGLAIWLWDVYWLDPALSALIAALLVWSSVDVLKEGGRVVMEQAPARINFDEVSSALANHKEILDVHDLHIWSLSSTEVALSCHIYVNRESLDRLDNLLLELQNLVREKFNISHSTIQVETDPCVVDSALCDAD